MSESQPKSPFTITVGRRRHFWPYVVIALIGASALVMDLIHGTDTPYDYHFGTTRIIYGLIISAVLWAFAWKYSIARFRTVVAIVMALDNIAQFVDGRLLIVDTFTFIEDIAFVAAAIYLAWPLKSDTKTFTSIEDYDSYMGEQKG